MGTWHLQGFARTYSGREAAELVRRRLDFGTCETWFEDGGGRLLAVVTNGTRAMVMMLDECGDAGEHAVDEKATGSSDGFALLNGQNDRYADRDTIPLYRAYDVVRHIIDVGTRPAHVTWESDR